MDRIKLKYSQVEFDRCPFCECSEYEPGFSDEGPDVFQCEHCGAIFNDLGPLGVEVAGWPKMDPDVLAAEVAA